MAVHQGSIADLKSPLEEGELDLALLNPLEGLESGFVPIRSMRSGM